MKVAFIGGTSIAHSRLFLDWEQGTVDTEHGAATFRRRGDHVVLNRHGPGVRLPPHAINHRANVQAIADLGFDDVLAIHSVGSLKPELPPGTIVSCGDYVGLAAGTATFFDRELRGTMPGIANNLIPTIRKGLEPEFEIHTGVVYVQARGPRFETPSEIRILRGWGDVVGMTLAHEADLCAERNLSYNSLAVVDNFANGIGDAPLSWELFSEQVKHHQARVDGMLMRILKLLG